MIEELVKPVRAKKAVKPPKEVAVEYGRKDVSSLKNEAILPYSDDSVDEFRITNVIEFLNPVDRIHLVNEIYRTLKSDSKAYISCHYWCASKAFGDLAVQWPPVSESWIFHLNKEWREKNNPYDDSYTCDFDHTWGYGMHHSILSRNQEYQQHAIIFWKEAAQDLMATLIKNR